MADDYGVVRWRFTDTRTGDAWTAYLNPNEMGAPPATRSLARGMHTRDASVGRMSSFETPVGITAWSFDGVILTKEHYDKLSEWSRKPGIVEIRDHLGRVFQVIFESFDPHEKVGRAPDDWKMTYTMNTQYLRRVA